MNLLQPPARDYVPRASAQIAASPSQAYAFFPHNTYDAEEVCFVPSNVSSMPGKLGRCHSNLATRGADHDSRFDPEGSSVEALSPAAFSPARTRRCTSAWRYLRRLSGTMPGAANSRRSETVRCGR